MAILIAPSRQEEGRTANRYRRDTAKRLTWPLIMVAEREKRQQIRKIGFRNGRIY